MESTTDTSGTVLRFRSNDDHGRLQAYGRLVHVLCELTGRRFALEKSTWGQPYIQGPEGSCLTFHSFTSTQAWHPNEPNTDDRLEFRLEVAWPEQGVDQLRSINYHLPRDRQLTDRITVAATRPLHTIAHDVLHRLVEPGIQPVKDILEELRRRADQTARRKALLERLITPYPTLAFSPNRNEAFAVTSAMRDEKDHVDTEVHSYLETEDPADRNSGLSFKLVIGQLPFELTQGILALVDTHVREHGLVDSREFSSGKRRSIYEQLSREI